MRLELTAVYQKVPDGYIAWVEEFPGALTQGDTIEQAREMLQDAVRLLIDAARDRSAEFAGEAGLRRERFIITD